MKRLFFTLMCSQFFVTLVMAQSTVITPGNSQPIIFSNTTSNGIQLPKLSPQNILAIANPSAGLTVYDTVAKCPRYFNGSEWVGINCPDADPLAVNQTVYVIGAHFADICALTDLVAYDANTGALKWGVATGSTCGDVVSSSPIVSNGIVYVANSYTSKAYDAATGTHKWDFNPPNSSISSGPIVANNVVYLGTGDGNLYALDATTGTQKWSFATGGAIVSSPIVADGVVYIGSNDGNLYAVDATTGTQRWSFSTGANVYSTPVVAKGVVFVVNADGKLYAIDEATGTLKWTFDAHYMISNPTVENGVVYIEGVVLPSGATLGDKNLYAIYATTGVEKWNFALGNNFNISNSSKNSSPVAVNGVIYASSGVAVYNSGGSAGALYAINADTGTQKWVFGNANANRFYTPTIANGIVYVGTANGYLYTIDANTGTQKWQIDLTNYDFSFSPCVVSSSGKVYRGLGNIRN